MSDVSLSTPALLFPAISLLLLAYTNRFLVLAQLIRELANKINPENCDVTQRQISNLRVRVQLIIWMQGLGVFSFLLCAVTMTLLYLGWDHLGHLVFGLSLLTMVASLMVSLKEIAISGDALKIQLENMKNV
jgi:hypothetical protein